MGSRDCVTCGLGRFLLTLMTMAAMAAIVMGAQVLVVSETLEPPVTHRLSAVFMAMALMSNIAMDRRLIPPIALGQPRIKS